MKDLQSNKLIKLVYALTIFLSAFLLFQVQPLIGKYILPWFGGSPSVWTTCMLFFQMLLFAGYAYAHFTSVRCSARQQAGCHAVLLALACLLLPIAPNASWKPTGSEPPVLQIVLLLTVSVGLPYFILASTGPLLQKWLSSLFEEPAGAAETRDPAPSRGSVYRLYALSNLGSLLALLSYPIVVEPVFSVRTQALIWSSGFIVFACLCTCCAILMARRARGAATTAGQGAFRVSAERPRMSVKLLWFGLAMGPSVMLLATTNQVTADVAVVPFLWVLPLSLYLMSFILCFDSDRWYSRRTFAIAMAISMAAVSALMMKGAGVSIIAQVTVYFAALFFCCMVCHGELVRLKPDPAYLTSFYLVCALGGAAGGLFVGIVAPSIFPSFLEMHVGIVGCSALALFVFFRDRTWVLCNGRPMWTWSLSILAMIGLAAALTVQAGESIQGSVTVTRNFYGVLRVEEAATEVPSQHRFKLMHGRIEHGMQFVSAAKRHLPTTYYGETSGVGVALKSCRMGTPIRVGAVGLGVGTIAAYGKSGDYFRFYEINPEVIRLAEQYFTYLQATEADVDVVLGDARLSLEREPAQQFDILVLDAFSGDAVPAHLLTAQAMEIYLRHLKPGGMIALHISNLHLDLQPVVAGLSSRFQLAGKTILSQTNDDDGSYGCLWVLLSRIPQALASRAIETAASPLDSRKILWTDERSNLFEILK